MFTRKRRLSVTFFGQFLEVFPILLELEVDWVYFVVVGFVTVVSLIGYNVEDWLRVAKGLRQVGDAVHDVADRAADVLEDIAGEDDKKAKAAV